MKSQSNEVSSYLADHRLFVLLTRSGTWLSYSPNSLPRHRSPTAGSIIGEQALDPWKRDSRGDQGLALFIIHFGRPYTRGQGFRKSTPPWSEQYGYGRGVYLGIYQVPVYADRSIAVREPEDESLRSTLQVCPRSDV